MDAPLTARGAPEGIRNLLTVTCGRESAPPRARVAGARLGQLLLELPDSAWMSLDALLVAVGFFAGYAIVGEVSTGYTVEHVHIWTAQAVFMGSFTAASLVFGLYGRETLRSRSRIMIRTLLTTFAAVILAYAVIYILLYAVVSRRLVCGALGVYLVSSLVLRFGAWSLIHDVRRSLLVVGSTGLLASLRRALDQDGIREYRLVGCTTPDGHSPEGAADSSVVGTHDELESLCTKLEVTDIVVGAEAARDPDLVTGIIRCLHRGLRVTNEATFYEKAAGRILVDELTPDWFLFADLKVGEAESVSLKRVIDFVVAALGLVVTLPLWALIAAAIKLDDGGPVFYAQERVGLRGRTFRLHKFRTMRTDAESGASIWATPNDPRVTRIGRILRRTRLDELPQLFDIVRGRMSLVGPRPERPDIVASLNTVLPYYPERHLIAPGLTGWAQINYKYGSSVEDARRKLQYDLYYLKHGCLELDLMILFRTLGTFLRGAC